MNIYFKLFTHARNKNDAWERSRSKKQEKGINYVTTDDLTVLILSFNIRLFLPVEADPIDFHSLRKRTLVNSILAAPRKMPMRKERETYRLKSPLTKVGLTVCHQLRCSWWYWTVCRTACKYYVQNVLPDVCKKLVVFSPSSLIFISLLPLEDTRSLRISLVAANERFNLVSVPLH